MAGISNSERLRERAGGRRRFATAGWAFRCRGRGVMNDNKLLRLIVNAHASSAPGLRVFGK